LDAETNINREDGSTASTAIFVGNHIYVANVGDSRTVMSKAGKGASASFFFSQDLFLNNNA
jgi:protein phosphatase 1L